MQIKNVTIKGYRSLREVSWNDLNDKVVVFGSNAVGKSNLLRIVNLLLVRIPYAAKSNQFTNLQILHEPAPMHPSHGEKTIKADITIEQELHAARTLLLRAEENANDASERATLRQMLDHLGEKERATVEMHVTMRPNDEWRDAKASGVLASIESVVVDGQVWHDRRHTEVTRNKPKRGGKKAEGAEDEQIPRVSAETLPYGHKLLIALTQGFVYIDCPRVLDTNETRVYSPSVGPASKSPKLERIEELEVARLTPPNWWLDIDDKFLASRLQGASQDPLFARRFEQLRKHLQQDHHGWLGIRSFYRNDDEILELFLSELQGLARNPDNSFYIPAAFQGTGFIQKLHILAACYLSGASVVGIEELEVNLAPPTQRDLWRWLREQIDRNGILEQVLVTSHSPIFLEGGRHGDEVDVWYASLDADRGTKLERLKRNDVTGEVDPVREKLRAHFGPMDRTFWKVGAETWHIPKSNDNANNIFAMYIDDDVEPGGFNLATLKGMLEKTKRQLTTELVFLEARRLSLKRGPQQTVDLAAALGIGRWLQSNGPPRKLMIEWTEMGTLNAVRKVRVEGQPAPEGEDQTLVLVVEERILRANLDDSNPEAFFREMKDGMAAVLTRLQDGLVGE